MQVSSVGAIANVHICCRQAFKMIYKIWQYASHPHKFKKHIYQTTLKITALCKIFPDFSVFIYFREINLEIHHVLLKIPKQQEPSFFPSLKFTTCHNYLFIFVFQYSHIPSHTPPHSSSLRVRR